MTAGVDGRGARPTPARALAGLLVPTALGAASTVLIWASSAPIVAVRAPGPAPVDALLSLGAALVCAAVLAGAAVGATLSLVVVLTGRASRRLAALAHLLTPRVVQAALGLAFGVAAVGGPVTGVATAFVAPPASTSAAATAPDGIGPAVIGPAATASRSSATEPGRHLRTTVPLPPGWSPDRPAAPAPHYTHTGPSIHTSTHDAAAGSGGTERRVPVVVVRDGDTLWGIAARHLGGAATDARVATEWPRWYAANRPTIGADPDLIRPGQRLHVPSNRRTIAHAPTSLEESP